MNIYAIYLCEGSTQSDPSPVNCLTLNTPPSPPTYVGGFTPPPPYPYPIKEANKRSKGGREGGRDIHEPWSVKKPLKIVGQRVKDQLSQMVHAGVDIHRCPPGLGHHISPLVRLAWLIQTYKLQTARSGTRRRSLASLAGYVQSLGGFVMH